MTASTLPRQLVLCPTCRDPLAGLLAGCNKPDCRRAEIANDVAFERTQDL